jgi:hypothetical protein
MKHILDINEFDTVSREVNEETNFVINQKIIKKQLDNNKSIYNYKSKYVLYFVKANKYERKLTSEKFHFTKSKHLHQSEMTVWLILEANNYYINLKVHRDTNLLQKN